MRARRRALSATTRSELAHRIVGIALRKRLLRANMRIAVYLPAGAEVDTLPLIDAALKRGCEIFVPRVSNHRRHRMEFVRWTPAARTRPNRFGIDEPSEGMPSELSMRQFDIVFLPLLAFSTDGWRLGSGAGYYDRRLAIRQRASAWRRPRLIGIAFDLQRVANGRKRPWDVPLDAVITETGFHPRQCAHEESQ